MKKSFVRAFFCSLLLLLGLIASASDRPLPVKEAFQLTATVQDSRHFNLTWQIAPHYHLYSDAFKIEVLAPAGATLADWQLPDGKLAFDPSRGQYLEYTKQVVLPLSLTQGSTDDLRLKVSFQGCADLGFCYPPQTQVFTLNPEGSRQEGNVLAASGDLTKIGAILAKQSLLGVWLSFWLFGLLLAFTPCVFPMLPILSSIIVGHGHKLSNAKAFLLSLVYVLASALTYAVAGAAAGMAGSHWQSALQNPWVLGVAGLLLGGLSLSLFGFYELQLPHSWQQRLNQLSRQQHGGNYLGAAVMGILSSLIVSPCVSAPLVGALAYIGQTGSAWLGGSALLMMGLGMGFPLLLIGLSAGRWLPKAGMWMNQVKSVFGVSLIWMAINLWARFLPEPVSLGLWGLLSVIVAVYLGAFEPALPGWPRLWKGLGLVMALYGACLWIGALSGQTNPWQPLPLNRSAVASVASKTDDTITTVEQLTTALAQAKAQQQRVVLDFYADWCVSCQVMKREVLDKPEVQQALDMAKVKLLRIDVTQRNADSQALQQRYDVIAPPTLVFIDQHGQALTDQTLVGEQDSKVFLDQVNKLVANP